MEKEIQFVFTRSGAWGMGELEKRWSKVQTSSYMISQCWGCHLQPDDYSQYCCVIYLKVVKRVDPKGLHHKENNVPSFSSLFCICMRCWGLTELIVGQFHSRCTLSHYAVLRLTQCCMSMISQ